MTLADRLVAYFSPVAALRREAARQVLAYLAARKDAAKRARRRDKSINELIGRDGSALRAHIRALERDHDLVRGAIRVLVNNTVGPRGIGIEPQPRRTDGSVDLEYARQLREAWRDWERLPEVTGRLSWAQSQRLVARSWLRDGEAFAQLVSGTSRTLDHGTWVPFSLELLESDMVPLDLDEPDRNIRQGVERNAWGRPVAFHVYKTDPREQVLLPRSSDLKRVPAERMLQIATFDRIGQVRGVTEFASVLSRLEDVKDYEDSERVAARIAARLTAYIRKGGPESFNPNSIERDEAGMPKRRELELEAGAIFDDLAVGEEIGLIKSDRPNPNLVTFRQGQLRAVAAGIGASYSSIARDYNGSWSSQRQELVEQWTNYATLTDDFVGAFVQPIWQQFVAVANASGIAPTPRDIVKGGEHDALFVGQQMPWIDPMKEANAWEKLVRAGLASEVEVIRRRGAIPEDVLEQIARFRGDARDRGLVFTSDAAHDAAQAGQQPDPQPSAEDDK